MKKFIKIKKIISTLIIGFILIPSGLVLLPGSASASSSWDTIQANKIAKTTVDGAIGSDILVVFAGYKVDLTGAETWANALVDSTLKSKGVKTVYAVAGPLTDTYDLTQKDQNGNLIEVKLEINKIVDDIVGTSIITGKYQDGARIFVIDHSSGVFPAKEFLSSVWLANIYGSSPSRQIPGNNYLVFNLDGNKTTFFSGSPTKINYDVSSSNKANSAEKSFYSGSAYRTKTDIPIDTTGCNTTAGVSTIKNCLHMRLVKKDSSMGFTKVNEDYNGVTPQNVQTDYLASVSANKVITISTLPCTINSAKVLPNNNQKDDWFVENTSKLMFVVNSKDCAGKEIGFQIREEDTTGDNTVVIKGLESEKAIAPNDKFIIDIVAGAEQCDYTSNPDCHIYFKVTNTTDQNSSNYKIYDSLGQPGGSISYNYNGSGSSKFIYKGIRENTAPDGQDPEVATAVDTSKPYNGDYNLLAPIGSLTKIDKTTTITDYLNILFRLGIGLLIALSVIMLVVHGIQYMGDESVFGKTEAMHSIRATIGGLLLALGAYALLNTINPDLVNSKLSVSSITYDVMTDNLTTPTETSSQGTALYPHGQVCADFAQMTSYMSMFTSKPVTDGGLLTQDVHECNGVDIGTYSKDPISIFAIAEGTVLESLNTCVIGDTTCGGGFGNYVLIQHANNIRTLYAHGVHVLVKKGDAITSGQKIMEMSNTGNSQARHLHLNVYNSKNPYAGKSLYKPI